MDLKELTLEYIKILENITKEIPRTINIPKTSDIKAIIGPRRVGKTSIMHKIKDEPKDNYIVIYTDTESADTENEFWHKLFNAMMEEDFINKLKIKSKILYEKFKNIKIKKISASGVEKIISVSSFSLPNLSWAMSIKTFSPGERRT